MRLIRLGKNYSFHYFQQIAKIHIAEIHFGFLPLLGEDLLAELYFELSDLPLSGLWIAEENHEVLGFISGTANFSKSVFELVKRAWPKLFLMGIRSLQKKGTRIRLPAILLYPLRGHGEVKASAVDAHTPNAELLSIAVRSTAHGKGIGKQLVLAFENALLNWGGICVYSVTTNFADPDSNAFYQKMGFEEAGQQRHNDLVLQVYKKNIKFLMN